MNGRFADNPAYLEYESLLFRLHALIAAGKGDSDEADGVREAMEAPERRLNRAEIDRLNGLSADLYLLQDDESLPGTILPEEFHAQCKEAFEWNDWGTVLALLRRRPPAIFPEVVAAWRARAYDALGHHEAALRFLDYSYKSKPADPSYLGLRMMFLSGAGRLEEAALDARRFLNTRGVEPLLVIASADILYQQAASRPGDEAASKRACHEILERLRPVLVVPGSGGRTPVSYRVIGHLVEALCLRHIGSVSEAIASIDAAFQADPGDRVLRRIRDLARAEADHERCAIAWNEALDHARDLARRTVPDRRAA